MSSETRRETPNSFVGLCGKTIETLQRDHLLLRGLLVTAAGFSRDLGECRLAGNLPQAAFIFCVSGCGWWESRGRLSVIRKGDLLVLPPGATHCCGPQASRPWTVHWVKAIGENLSAYLRELALGPQTPVLRVGDSPHTVRLFAEISSGFAKGSSYSNLLQVSNALAYLLSRLIGMRQSAAPESCDTTHSVAQAIIYMSEHIGGPLRITALARLAGLSPAHFGELFKRHTGCSPREYLHLLRIHQACRLLTGSALSIKEIAARVGYSDPLHFSRQFKAFEGIPPTDFRQSRTG